MNTSSLWLIFGKPPIASSALRRYSADVPTQIAPPTASREGWMNR